MEIEAVLFQFSLMSVHGRHILDFCFISRHPTISLEKENYYFLAPPLVCNFLIMYLSEQNYYSWWKLLFSARV